MARWRFRPWTSKAEFQRAVVFTSSALPIRKFRKLLLLNFPMSLPERYHSFRLKNQLIQNLLHWELGPGKKMSSGRQEVDWQVVVVVSLFLSLDTHNSDNLLS